MNLYMDEDDVVIVGVTNRDAARIAVESLAEAFGIKNEDINCRCGGFEDNGNSVGGDTLNNKLDDDGKNDNWDKFDSKQPPIGQ